MDLRWSSRAKPYPPVELAWGSQSMRRVLRPSSARAAERLMAVVVLPTPPFWFTTARTFAMKDQDYCGGGGKANGFGCAEVGTGCGRSLREQELSAANDCNQGVYCGSGITLSGLGWMEPVEKGELFHVEQSFVRMQLFHVEHCRWLHEGCSTWNNSVSESEAGRSPMRSSP